jgi:hypothetical protein
MRKFLLIIAVIFTLSGLAFMFFPIHKFAILPVVLALFIEFPILNKSGSEQKTFPVLALIISAISLLVIVGKVVLFK